VPKMVAGEWTGTMNLTEPQAGSDVGALSTKAVPATDGTWRISGQKIFITYGEHDLTDNIIHMVLARVPTPRARPASRVLSSPNICRAPTAHRASATACAACPSNTSWASTLAHLRTGVRQRGR